MCLFIILRTNSRLKMPVEQYCDYSATTFSHTLDSKAEAKHYTTGKRVLRSWFIDWRMDAARFYFVQRAMVLKEQVRS